MSEPAAPPSVLVVEDEDDVRALLAMRLGREGYRVREAADGETALETLRNEPYDLIVLDWMLPRLSGVDLIHTLRFEMRLGTPILMVTARVDPTDIVRGLEAGADDYITKPFELPVLLSRVRALLRRTRGAPPAKPAAVNLLRIDELSIDLDAYEVRCHDELVSLTASEFRLLVVLIQNRGRVLTRDRLIDLVRGENVNVVGRSIDTHVFSLRRKLGRCSDLVETIRGVGYRVKGGA